MKKYFILTAAALAFAACTSDEIVPQQVQETIDDGVVAFDAYANRATTRAGWAGTLDNAALQGDANGFGVFGYYTNGEVYGETAKPDFMYNQQVTYSGGSWIYTPLKYWPNEFGTNAASEEIDRLTFFAYAPYVEVTPSTGIATGDVTTGIVGMTRNTFTGNPLIKYYANLTPASGVDLCWGVAQADYNNSVVGTGLNNVVKGAPFIDVAKPAINDKISFDFKHALAQLNVQIDADLDALSHSSSTLDANTRIYVRSITFEGFAIKGSLDLNSDFNTSRTPDWYDIAGSGKLSTDAVIVYDGRRDGKEGVESASAKNETPSDLNPDIVQSKAYTTTISGIQYTSFDSDPSDPGVTNNPTNLFNSATLEAPVLVIPTQEDMTVTIVYDVETADATLSTYLSDSKTHGSTIENAITQEIKLSDGSAMTLEAGNKYTIKLHLGMTSVKFEASVSNWDDSDEADVDLPINAGASAGSPMSINVGSDAAAGLTLTIEGLIAGNELSVTRSTSFISAPSIPSTVPANGKAILTYGVDENTTTLNRSGIYTISEANSGTPVTTTPITINQAAHPIELGISSTGTVNGDVFERTPDKDNIGLTSGATGIDWLSPTTTVTVKDGETTLTQGTDYTWIPGSQQLTLTGAALTTTGNKILSITVNSGDAAPETIKVKFSKL